jgi:hypothetical protein
MHWASGIPARPLFEGGRFFAKLGRNPRREIAKSYLAVIPSAATCPPSLAMMAWLFEN